MRHILFTIPGIDLSVPAYGFMMMIGFLSAIMWAARRAEKSKGNPDVVLNCGFVALIGGVLGARVMFIAAHWHLYEAINGTTARIIAMVNLTQGGLEFYGGFICATLGTMLYLVIARQSLRWYLDIVAPSVMVGLAFGRIGCFMNGCCWGGVCDLPWAVEFPFSSPPAIAQWEENVPGSELPAELVVTGQTANRPLSREFLLLTQADLDKAKATRDKAYEQFNVAANKERVTSDELGKARKQKQLVELKYSVEIDTMRQMSKFGLKLDELQTLAGQRHSLRVHPAQLYASLSAFLLAFLLSAFYWRRKRDGQVICLLLIVQPVIRVLLEAIRTDVPPTVMGLTRSQAIAVVLVLAGVIGMLVLQALPPRSPRATEWIPPEEPKKKEKGKG